MSTEDSDLLRAFVLESRDLIAESSQSLLLLEREPTNRHAMQRLFRAMHTLKGASGLFDLAPYTRLLHHAEDLLSGLEARGEQLAPDTASTLLECLDAASGWTDCLEAQGCLPGDVDGLSAALLGRLAAPGGNAVKPDQAGASLVAEQPWVRDLPAGQRLAIDEAAAGRPLTCITYRPDENAFFRGEDPLRLVLQVPGLLYVKAGAEEPWPELGGLDPFQCRLVFQAVSASDFATLEHHFRYVTDQVAWSSHDVLGSAQGHAVPTAGSMDAGVIDNVPATAESTRTSPDPRQGRAPVSMLRVEQGRVDLLMNLVGEIVVLKNSFPYLANRIENGEASPRQLARELREREAQLHRVAEDLQAAIMAVRMMPMSTVFQRFPRLVRDTAQRLGKTVELSVEGETIEADKNVVEGLAEPLIHMIRNSLDHGLEQPAERLASGKAPAGLLSLSARQDNESIIVVLKDDGRGIDPARVRARAIERGLLKADQAEAMSDADAVQLVFAPGFSTADAVSDLSGRGVGMDAVRTSVERMGGHVELHSRKGEGSTVTLTLPLSMAMSQIVIVEAGAGQMFGVPMGLVAETLKIPASQVRTVKGRDAFVLRDKVLPLRHLNEIMDLPGAARGEHRSILVIRSGHELVGLAVDRICNSMKTIVKPMEGPLALIRGFVGTTFMGDGRVLFVLDPREMM